MSGANITIWTPAPTRTIHWDDYDTCPRCGAEPEAVCVDQRANSERVRTLKLPHRGRPLIETVTVPRAELERLQARVAELEAAVARYEAG